jgi:ABC-type transporter Mla subunit MlaD
MSSNATLLIIVTALALLALAGVLVWVTYKTRGPRRPTTTDTTIDDDVEPATAAPVIH